MSRPSALRHPLAVLRKHTGETQGDFAKKAGCSARAIQAIELGQLKLSESLALKIEAATGADASWLLAGNPEAPMNFPLERTKSLKERVEQLERQVALLLEATKK